MRIAIDVGPLQSTSAHKVRGTGSYIELLREGLIEYFPDNTYFFFNQKDGNIPKSDIVHFPYFEPFFLKLPFVLPKKAIVTVHDLTPLVFPSKFPAGIKGVISWNIQKQILHFASAIITDSKSSKKDIVKILGIADNKVHVVYLSASSHYQKLQLSVNAVDEILKKYGLPKKFAMYVGDATWNKNLPNLVKATTIAHIPLVMVGKVLTRNITSLNSWNASLNMTKKHINSNSNFFTLGFISSEELAMLYNIATLVVMPSFYEGFGLPILEAMESGCPVVASDRGSIPEVGGDAIYYVDPESVESIAKGIDCVFKNIKLQNELSRKCLVQAKKFSVKKMIEETVDVYKLVM